MTMTLVVVMLGGSFVSFAPNISAADVQNLFIKRTMLFGLLIFGVQIYSLFIVLKLWKSYDMNPRNDKMT